MDWKFNINVVILVIVFEVDKNQNMSHMKRTKL
jgi:hypothetical protein